MMHTMQVDGGHHPAIAVIGARYRVTSHGT